MLLLILGAAILATSDIITATALMRAGIYVVPLVLVLRTKRGRDWLLLQVALAWYALNSCLTVFGVSREVVSLLAVMPAALLAWSIINYVTDPARTT